MGVALKPEVGVADLKWAESGTGSLGFITATLASITRHYPPLGLVLAPPAPSLNWQL